MLRVVCIIIAAAPLGPEAGIVSNIAAAPLGPEAGIVSNIAAAPLGPEAGIVSNIAAQEWRYYVNKCFTNCITENVKTNQF